MKISNFFGKRQKPRRQVAFHPVRTDAKFCVIGDVHGRLDLLAPLVEALPPKNQIICVGDLIDRGDQSGQVLDYVMQHDRIMSLMGNHEQMMLDFLQTPETAGGRWVRNGGLQTLASFGIAGVTETSGAEALSRARDALFDAMGQNMATWVARLECFAWSGNVAVVHAGANPNTPLDQQDPDTFIWGHPDFRKIPRDDGFWIVHGHTIVDQPTQKDGRISIDTGAYATGRLSAAVVSPDGMEFVTT
ncbi:MAG: serine/threonine protein phosphatase [Spiribacter salinus]|uniref:Serine/threonine protein phosphatase n=1 Tax=Spiribacter salinus TaxID=1335746 RepID=A0A540VBT7_9GAMM|nr:MAG: serine/threonine protein phosphatase [Spiribacter salinus]